MKKMVAVEYFGDSLDEILSQELEDANEPDQVKRLANYLKDYGDDLYKAVPKYEEFWDGVANDMLNQGVDLFWNWITATTLRIKVEPANKQKTLEDALNASGKFARVKATGRDVVMLTLV